MCLYFRIFQDHVSLPCVRCIFVPGRLHVEYRDFTAASRRCKTCARYALFLQRHLATRIRVVVGILFMHRPRWLMCTTQLLHDLGFYFPTVQKPKMRCEEFVMFMCTALHCPALISYTRTSSYYYAVVSLLESHSLMELICAVVLPEVAQFLVCLFSRIFVIACFEQIEIALFGRLI